jgi:Major capsid protein N-terminus/Large eukaryotic DNA virus major capsid protein
MPGALSQLSAFGSQDAFLTGNPDITFFKKIYRRHTNFAMESVSQQFQSTASFGKQTTVTIARTGDLINRVWLEITLPALSTFIHMLGVNGATPTNLAYVNDIGHVLFNSVTLEIGGAKIDRHYGEFMDIWHNLTEPQEKLAGLNEMIGHYDDYDNTDVTKSNALQKTYYIPLLFFFNRDTSNSLPLIALSYHEVKLNFDFRTWQECIKSSGGALLSLLDINQNSPEFVNALIYVDYIYIDSDERRRFAATPHEYLIDTIQHTGDENILATQSQVKINLNYSNPVKELIWIWQAQQDYAISSNTGNNIMKYSMPSSPTSDPFSSVQLYLNGHERFSPRSGAYFRLIQSYQHHTRTPSKPIYVYSFSLSPEESQPSGTANFSRFDTASLNFTMNPALAPTVGSSGYNGRVKIYATSFNVLRILSGMASLTFVQ